MKKEFNLKRFADLIANARTINGITQKELADKCGLTPYWISHFECGRRAPNLANFVKLCRALRVSSDYILDLK